MHPSNRGVGSDQERTLWAYGAYLPQQDVTSLNSVWVQIKRGRFERRAKSVSYSVHVVAVVVAGVAAFPEVMKPLHTGCIPLSEMARDANNHEAIDRLTTPRLTPVGSTDRCHEEAK